MKTKELKPIHVTLCPEEKITSKSNIETYLLQFEKENVNVFFGLAQCLQSIYTAFQLSREIILWKSAQ